MNEHDFVAGMLEQSARFYGQDDLEKIKTVRVAHAGFGGVGALILELLARWGVKRFRLLDMDKYELSNLNRQVFATSKTIGQFKTEAAAKRIKEINPYVDVEVQKCERMTNHNVVSFIQDADVIINGIDFPSGQLPLHYHAQKLKIPVINPHCMQVTKATIEVFDYRREDQQSIDAPTKNPWVNHLMHKYLKLFQFNEDSLSDESLEKADKRFCSKRGVTLNYVTNLAACLAVAETIKLLTGKGKQVLYPSQIMIDPQRLSFNIRSVYSLERYINFMKERFLKK
ncbi:MAG: ThiF family adenylyltransferase [Candidatus Omnitrophica bacterium]|nr:ThiF family adenylyltransferase [Candidatus Omnitrophota bacterium]